ncbi:MAG TPA: YigZ family protein [Gemmatimonadota bacterium]|nr:YigZ family protein [Gemmatimonadota bacterium]
MRSPAGAAEAQVTVKGSRFQAWLAPANDIETARSALAHRTRAHPDATHHGWAFRIWKDGRVEGAGFDAGEPAGTTGRPILGALERAEVVSAVCVVSRWFGGTKLGTGGLTRAYAEAARGVVAAAEGGGLLVEVEPWTNFRITFPYEVTSGVQRVLARHGARVSSSEYAERVVLITSVRSREAVMFEHELADGSGGVAVATRMEERLLSRA